MAELTDEQIDAARDAFDWDGWIEPKNALRAFVREMIALSATGAEDAARRTPQDYAIEHAEYMAKAAEQLVDAVNDLAKADEEHDDGLCEPSDVSAAHDTVNECLSTVRDRVYEFRKRRDRAARAQSNGDAGGGEVSHG